MIETVVKTFVESAIKGAADVKEIVVASSSVGSDNSVERPSDDPTENLKRKHRDTEESEGPSVEISNAQDVEEESVGAKKQAPAREGNGSRETGKQKFIIYLKGLNYSKFLTVMVDIASMLDEAIEYLKTLQLQVQIMSMGAGLYMPSMMFTLECLNACSSYGADITHGCGNGNAYGNGNGNGFGMSLPDVNGGSSGCPMYQVPLCRDRISLASQCQG
ncbi:hypothetical protein NC652_015154 [Populus alba x Populus x berolinensis]|nr:hypothetical protein NC652_015154 [Populus alba x Populus x berolinensis]